MKTNKTIGILFITGAIALFIPYTILTINFGYPDILRQDTTIILSKFHEGGSNLIWTWFAFALTGIPLLPAYIFLGQKLENKSKLVRFATTIGVIGLVVQMIGLLRWTFVVPVLADTYVNSHDPSLQAAAIVAFKTIHQFGGVILGEHLGQLFTIAWTVLISFTLSKLRIIPVWMGYLGQITSVIYLMAQAELLQTVIPTMIVWNLAGFLGSTLWLIWLILVGILLIKNDPLTSH